MEDLKMKKIERMQTSKLKKALIGAMATMFMIANKVNAADVVSEVSGGGRSEERRVG